MNISDLNKFNLPDNPGVYTFLKGNKKLYIGKATYLKDRVKSYFSNDLIKSRGSRIVDMVTISDKVEFKKTDSVLEALILEANLVKKYQPLYNTLEKDNKSFNFVCITKDLFPKVLIRRERNIDFNRLNYKEVFGPFPSQTQLNSSLKIIRKIFPYYGENNTSSIYRQIGLEPNKLSKSEYLLNIKHIKLFFQGKKRKIMEDLNKKMISCAKREEFEKANIIKKQIFALNHIRDVSLIKDENIIVNSNFRIEGYDVAHMRGTNSVGVMVVIEDSEIKKSEYKQFNLKYSNRGDDIGALEEILTRRLKHLDWNYPDLIVVDGGIAQMNKAIKVIKESGLNIPVVSVVKDDKHKPKDILGHADFLIDKYKKDILILNSEAHRFSINLYRNKHRKTIKK